ncbi:MAG: GAF domain-containing protein [Candidatus Bipolaricaulia bacterium]
MEDIGVYEAPWVIFTRIGRLMEASRSSDEILETTLQLIDEVLNADASSIVIKDPDREDRLVFRAVTGEKQEQLQGRKMPLAEGVVGWVIRHGEPLIIPDPREDPRFYGEIDQAIDYHTQNILCVPIKLKDRTIGAIELINKNGKPSFTLRDRYLLMTIAGQVSLLLENARLGERLNRIER